ncbi:MAG: hypothetical protein K6G61_03055 [Solobacterium sp.]|nr:hypothetical protein [Solobacterium sp.]
MAELRKKQRNKETFTAKKHRRDGIEESEPEQDERFAYIAGYTSGGFPYGLTWEEVKGLPDDTKTDIWADDLPF